MDGKRILTGVEARGKRSGFFAQFIGAQNEVRKGFYGSRLPQNLCGILDRHRFLKLSSRLLLV